MPLFESISLKLLCTSTKGNDSGHSKLLGNLAAIQNRRSLLSKNNYNTNDIVNGWINEVIVSAHRRILGMASVVCVLVKICVSSILLYKLDTDKLTAPFESAHQFTLVCTVSDSKTVSGCHYNLCSNHSFVLTD